ncbi:putative Serine/threonine-protein phosphatase 2A 65 kDa regulatory subunit A beta [Blattamonas nauphoetae]|uniref:Serine/threonine-protein phosphatase 2A 65 kDa regulatory subunit A beta n=1 Tax=Blattamonas nauphoetae TaxID=2049346 RepID=A0ABQ9YE86_9EUKA|nr:putative Serine/threonine-protein phosphatase 2A 65 kDa regulatory subunit A beta [Blattamonas nauphoetae]
MTTGSRSPATDSSSDDPLSIPLLLGDLRVDVYDYKVSCAKRLGMIAIAIGPERTRKELLTLLPDYFDVEDEILSYIAEELGTMIPFIGGQEYYPSLVSPLEKLCLIEDMAVSQKATQSLQLLIQASTAPELSDTYMEMLNHLSAGEWFTGKVAAASLIPHVFKQFPSTKPELVKILNTLAKDQTPMVRETVGKSLETPIPYLTREDLNTIVIPLLTTLYKDDLDVVRLVCVQPCPLLATLIPPEDVNQHIAPIIRDLSADKAWRVRQSVADHLDQWIQQCPSTIKLDALNIWIKLVKDDECEVRLSALSKLLIIAPVIFQLPPLDQAFSKEFSSIARSLFNDDVLRVREMIAKTIVQLAPHFGKMRTTTELVPLVKEFLNKEDTPEVKLALLQNMNVLLELLEPAQIDDLLHSQLDALAYNRQWRIREAMLKLIPQLVKQMPREFFNQNLLKVSLGLLGDSVFNVRATACQNMQELTKILGSQWAVQMLVPNVSKLATEKHYLYRMTTLLAVSSLAPAFNPEELEEHLLPIALRFSTDTVPNLRFNLCKCLAAIRPYLRSEAAIGKVKQTLEHLQNDKDKDVKYHAQKALTEYK